MTCRHCGKPEEEHHEYEEGKVPDGCVCDLRTWHGETPGPICATFIRHPESGYCTYCEHDRACHAGQKTT